MGNKTTYTYQKYEDNKTLIQICALAGMVLLFFLFQTIIHFSSKYLFIFLVLFFLLINFLEAYLSGQRRRNYLSWGRGAGAEWIIGNELDKLPFTYKLLPDYQSGHGNIDHICVGQTGIFAIEVKAHHGVVTNVGNKILLNRQPIPEKDVIFQAKGEVFFLEKLLKDKTGKFYPVTGLLVFPNAQIAIRKPINGIWVGGRNFCNWVIRNKPNGKLNDNEINYIYKALSDGEMV